MKNQRNVYLDIIKGVAIILVVFGHSIQYGTGLSVNNDYFQYPLFIFIYSFHMPLFMLISGFLFFGSVKRHSVKYNCRSKFTSLLIPIIAWNTINLIVGDAALLIKGKEISCIDNLLSYFTATWFLWSIFWCSIIVLLIRNLFKDNIFVYLLIGICLLLINDKNKVLGISYHTYMYPYFVAGYLWNKFNLYQAYNKISNNKKLLTMIVCVIVFILMLFKYNNNDYVYTTGTAIILNGHLNLSQVSIDLYRYTIGFVGSACILMVIKFSYYFFAEHASKLLILIGQKRGLC